MASGLAQRSEGNSVHPNLGKEHLYLSSLSTRAWYKHKSLQEERKKTHIKGTDTGSSENKDIQPSPQPSWKLPHLSPLPRIISFNHFSSQHCQRSTREVDLEQLCWNQFILYRNHILFSLKKLSCNEGYTIIPLYLRSLFQGLIKMT